MGFINEDVRKVLFNELLDHQPIQTYDGRREFCDCSEPFSISHQADVLAEAVSGKVTWVA